MLKGVILLKIEKIDENKVRITLTIDELSQREISIKDIEQDSLRAQDLFLDLIEESELNEDFIVDGSQLFVEASSDSNNLFIVTITKIDSIPELSKYSNKTTCVKKNVTPYKKMKKEQIRKNEKINNYSVASSIFKFNSFDNILMLCDKLKLENAFMGTNSLFKNGADYFIIFGNSTIKNAKFLKTFVLLSEFSESYYATDLYKTLIEEKARLIIEKKALQKLSKI